jgi:hypothetical protein
VGGSRPPRAEVAGHFIKRFRTVLPFQSLLLALDYRLFSPKIESASQAVLTAFGLGGYLPLRPLSFCGLSANRCLKRSAYLYAWRQVSSRSAGELSGNRVAAVVAEMHSWA